jgi:hypothetical protein
MAASRGGRMAGFVRRGPTGHAVAWAAAVIPCLQRSPRGVLRPAACRARVGFNLSTPTTSCAGTAQRPALTVPSPTPTRQLLATLGYTGIAVPDESGAEER